MQPVNLKMQAFGAYPELVEIPFNKLNKNNIFLISGKTGSGKTTIFDAICFALFNNSSTQNRGNTTLRSHFAKEETQSFVEFTFLFNDEIYKIYRTPQYSRKKARGEGFIKVNPTAELYLPNGDTIAGVREVDNYIEELLGLNLSQFSQIALLAQGEFIKLLNSSTEERSKIFRNIFKTNNYQKFQEELKNRYLNLKKEIDYIKASILQYVLQYKTQEPEILDLIEFYKKENVFNSLDDFILKIENENILNDKYVGKIQKELDILSKEKDELQLLFEKIKTKNTLLKDKLLLSDEHKKEEENFEKYKKEYDLIEEKKKKISDFELDLKELKKEIETINQINFLEKDLKNYSKNEEIFKKELEKNQEKIEDLKINFLKYLFFEMKNEEKKLKSEQENFTFQREKTKKLNENFNNLNNEYLSMQAGILAQNLIDNAPCPVCGSRVHPKKAKILNKNITKEFLDNLKKELNSEQEELNNLSNSCSILIEKNSQKEKEFSKFEKEFNISFDKDNFILENILKIDYDFEKENYLKEQEKINSNLIENNNKIISLNSQIETLKKTIKNKDDASKIEEKYQNILNEKEKLEKNVSDIEKKYQNSSLKLKEFSSKLEIIETQLSVLKDIQEKNIEEIEENLAQAIEKINEINLILKQKNLIKGINDDVYKNLKEKSKELKKQNEIFMNYETISNCANANLKGKSRVTFEQYVQSYYLDLVLFEANKLLKTLTSGQFQLLRKQELNSKQSKESLDLEIFDFHTYKPRSTKTLSGGESFKTALALAFGLSNTVSSLSGAININSLFIDEGFGSLDSESLEIALDVISTISSANRIIGIISHIDELKTRIPNQILSIKSANGSKVEVNFD